MPNETGESTASMNARYDKEMWPRILAALQGGATLYRPAKLTRYFTQCRDNRDPNEGIGITAGRVKNLEASGVLIRVGVDRYGLGNAPPPTLRGVKTTAPVELQPSLF